MEPKQYIDKAAVVTEIQRRIDLLKSNQNPGGPIFCFAREVVIEEYKNILSFLDTLEVKEVDLEEKARHYLLHEHLSPLISVMHQADLRAEMQYDRDIENAYKAGFELGLKAQKEEFKKESETNCPNFDEAQGTPILS